MGEFGFTGVSGGGDLIRERGDRAVMLNEGPPAPLNESDRRGRTKPPAGSVLAKRRAQSKAARLARKRNR